jgi:Outer membrane protein beta-barrel family/Carboxypeptidase regulatory-like domain
MVAQAQQTGRSTDQSFSLFGRITDSAGSALYPATVQYTSTLDSFHTLTSDNGQFRFARLQNRKFKLTITMKGYLPFSRSYNVAEGKASIQLPAFCLQTDYLSLDPVTIRRVRPITFSEDTVTYHASAFPVRDGSEVEDILKRLPGVEVDMDGNVIVQGKKISKVLVDGKEFFGSDVLLAIRNLPADIVDKLEVIDDFGDKARLTGVRSGDMAKVLNIVLKPDKRNGEFGQAEVGLGNQDKYTSEAFGNTFKADRQLSARVGSSNNSLAGSDRTESGGASYANQWNPRWGGDLNVAAGSEKPHSGNEISQYTSYPGEMLQQTQNNRNNARNQNSNLGAQLTYKPDGYSTLRATASGSVQQSISQVSSQYTTFQQDSGYTKSSNGTLVNSIQSTGQTLNTNVYYEKISPNSRRRFSIDGGLGYNCSNAFNNTQSTETVTSDSSATPSFLHYLVSNNTKNSRIHLNSNYFLPLGKVSFLELGYRMVSSASRIDLITKELDSSNLASVIIDSMSQQMVLHSLSQTIHSGLTAKIHHFDLTVGLNAQVGRQEGTADSKGDLTSYAYLAILPSLQAAWNIAKGRRLNLNYSSRPNLPSLQQLAPFTNVSNPQYPVTGNPGLNPSYTDNFALHYEQSSLHPTQFFGFGLGLAYSSTRHTIIQDLTSPRDSSQIIQAITYLNARATDNLIADYHLSLPALLHKRIRININGNVGRSQDITMIDSIQYISQSFTWNQSLHFQVIIPDLIESDLSGNYTLTRNSYFAGGNTSNAFQSASITFRNRLYFLRYWILNYQFSQSYVGAGSRLQTVPANLTASILRQFLPHNSASVVLSAYNVLNQSSAASQLVSSTTATNTKSQLTGRYYLLTFRWKLQHFH